MTHLSKKFFDTFKIIQYYLEATRITGSIPMRFYFYKTFNPYDKIETGDTIELRVGTMLYSNSVTCAKMMECNMAKPGQKRKPALFDVTLCDKSVVAGDDGTFKVTPEMINKLATVNRVKWFAPISSNLKGESLPKNQSVFFPEFPEPPSVNSAGTDEYNFASIQEDFDAEQNTTYPFQ